MLTNHNILIQVNLQFNHLLCINLFSVGKIKKRKVILNIFAFYFVWWVDEIEARTQNWSGRKNLVHWTNKILFSWKNWAERSWHHCTAYHSLFRTSWNEFILRLSHERKRLRLLVIFCWFGLHFFRIIYSV